MATQSVRIGWRPYVNLTSVQATANLLDSYSGAAAGYSLRKIKSSYTGSAIRVRRSSDNTELNIGFDSDGNLDTYALSAFVGTGDGFVTTWYDQSGNVKNATQSTAANQPYIIVGGALQTLNGKPSLFFNGESRYLDCGYLNNGTKASNFSTFISANFTAVNQTRSIFSSMDAGGNGKDTYNTFGIHSAIAYQMFGGAGGGIYYKYWRTSNVPTQSLPYLFEQHYKSNISPFIGTFYWNNTAQSTTDWLPGSSTISGGTEFKTSIGRSGENNGGYHQGFVQEIATYFSDQMSNRSGIVSNINTYYSIYPNPSSVWNLLTAAYSADAVGSSSLKTSLVSVYNGESNANDSKGTNNGTAQGGLTYTTGKIGNAFNFNGSNAYVGLPNNSLNFTSDFSISLWVYLTAFPSEQIPIGNYYESSPSAGNSRGWMIYMSGQNLYWIVCGSSQVNLITSISSFQNTWKQITITFKNGVGSKIYFDGSLVISNSSTITPIYNSTQTPFIGKYQYGNGSSFGYVSNGSKIDALNIWNKELTQSEITELYNSGNGAQYIGDNFYKPTTNDALNTNNGTAIGGLTYTPGKVGTAFQFNGTNAYVSLPNNMFNSFTGDFSVNMWVNIVNTGTAQGLLTCFQYTGGNAYGFSILNFGTTTVQTCYGTPTGYTNLVEPGQNPYNTWYMVTVTRKSGVGTKIYYNGTLTTSNSDTNAIAYTSPMSTNIGVRNSSGAGLQYYAANGTKIDALNIWNKALTATEITELYNSGNGKQYPN